MDISYLIVFIIVSLKIYTINAVNIKAIAYTYANKVNVYSPIVDEFNKYSEENGLDINLKLEMLTEENSTSSVIDYSTFMDSLLKKKSIKYDLYFFNSAYTNVYSPHFIDLKEYLPKEHIDMFDSGIIDLYTYNDKLIGIPVNIDMTALYSNQILLSKYNKTVPRTWNELIDTAKYILEEEKKINNTDLVGYNGLFEDGEDGTLSIFEFIHSFRDSNNSTHPEVNSKATMEALKMMKRVKNEISSDSQFSSGVDNAFELFYNGKAIFLKLYYMEHIPIYTSSAIPGWNDKVSGDIAGGTNIGICSYINEIQRNSSLIALKFMTSKKIQTEYIAKRNLISGISSIYLDEDLCKQINCDIVRYSTPFSGIPYTLTEYSTEKYLAKFRKYVLNYLYNEEDVSTTIKKLDDLSKIYYYTLSTKYCNSGLTMFCVFVLFTSIMIFSLIFLFIKKYESHFQFLPKDFFIISVIGSFIIMCSVLTLYGKPTIIKCHLTVACLTFGFALSVVPPLYKFSINFPKKNKISNWIENHRYIFLSMFLPIYILINALLTVEPFTLFTTVINEGENYQKCIGYTQFIMTLLMLIPVVDSIILIILSILIFIEWSIKETHSDTRWIFALVLMDFLDLAIFFSINYIEIKNYVAYYNIMICIYFSLSMSNYIFVYGIRILKLLIRNDNEKEFKSIMKEFQENNELFCMSTAKSDDDNTATFNTHNNSNINLKQDSNTNLNNKLLSYHYREMIE
ncbi:periplasmic binding protein-like II [Anaeromyces robustus]|uniref:Periplasmic binding protein-like II n=1 Tax=Anaeromyces robustus TaxID=1754192 RepID=A0A1Y1X8G0_9FUNG|nr:periplasmic binding protein-like II [Anaeromyces robustus]|eukprot:ORX82029.1 periplasmic binding protein-like II [Anaeromyces robustus]